MMVGLSLAGGLGAVDSAVAQALKDVQAPDKPLVLKAQGSFFVGGEKVEQTQGELGDLGPGGHITVNQMYVRYMVPQGGDGNPPVVMVHGATLTGKSWETTPDGRMGWDEYSCAGAIPCTCLTRWAVGDRGSTRQCSTTRERDRGQRTVSLDGFDSVMRVCGPTSASGRKPASPIQTRSSR